MTRQGVSELRDEMNQKIQRLQEQISGLDRAVSRIVDDTVNSFTVPTTKPLPLDPNASTRDECVVTLIGDVTSLRREIEALRYEVKAETWMRHYSPYSNANHTHAVPHVDKAKRYKRAVDAGKSLEAWVLTRGNGIYFLEAAHNWAQGHLWGSYGDAEYAVVSDAFFEYLKGLLDRRQLICDAKCPHRNDNFLFHSIVLVRQDSMGSHWLGQ